jgi:hypothetical protein
VGEGLALIRAGSRRGRQILVDDADRAAYRAAIDQGGNIGAAPTVNSIEPVCIRCWLIGRSSGRRVGWRRWNQPQSPQEEAAMKHHIDRGSPLGAEDWARRTAAALNLERTLRPRGCPPGWRKQKTKEAQ